MNATHVHERCNDTHPQMPDDRWRNPHCVECGQPIIKCGCPDCRALPFMERKEPRHDWPTESELRALDGDR